MDITTRTTKQADEFSGEWAELSGVMTSGRRASVEVYGPEMRFGGTESIGARVNWSGIGSVALTDALDYADLIRAAVAAGVKLAGPTA